MEKKTIGQFLSALRKAGGMTQKELAEKLHVSNKAVSRWERDECAPDLSLIPVIADIFGVTSDELLPIRVYTQNDFTYHDTIVATVNTAFVILYFIEFGAAVGIYLRKRPKQ